MKKILFWFGVAFLFFCPYIVKAASIKIEGPNGVYMVGDTITVNVTLEENEGLGSWEFYLNYDSLKLKLLSGDEHVVDYVRNEGETSRSYTYIFEVLRAGSALISIENSEVASWNEVITNPSDKISVTLKGNYWVEENGNWYLGTNNCYCMDNSTDN